MRRSKKETEKNTETLYVLDEIQKQCVPDIQFSFGLYVYIFLLFVRLKTRRKGSFSHLPAAACLSHALLFDSFALIHVKQRILLSQAKCSIDHSQKAKSKTEKVEITTTVIITRHRANDS